MIASPRRLSALTALLIFLMIDLSMRNFDEQIRSGLSDTLQTSEAANAIRTYQGNADVSERVVFLGSSLVREALHGRDKAFLAPVFSGQQGVVMSLACSGAVASDCHLLATNLFTDQKRPRLVVWGIGPAGFIQGNTANITIATATVSYFNRLGVPIPVEYFESVGEFLECVYRRVSYLYDHKNGVTTLCIATATPVIDSSADACITFLGGKRTVTETEPMDRWAYSLGVYWDFYHPFVEWKYEKQLRYFDSVLKHCRAKNIPIVIVKMPMREVEVRLMGDATYKRYNADIARIARRNATPLLDFSRSKHFKDENFKDLVHLDTVGAKIFRKELETNLIDQLKNQSQVCTGPTTR